MSEHTTAGEPLSQTKADAVTVHNAQSPGAVLRAARELQGLHVAHLAAMLKVPPQRLQALEADHFEALPDMVFARALYGSACRCLKIDPTPMLALLPLPGAKQMHGDDEGLNATFKDSGAGGKLFSMGLGGKPMTWALLVMLVGILAVIFWPKAKLDAPQTLPQPQLTAPSPAAVPAAETSTLGEEVASVPAVKAQETAPATVAIAATAIAVAPLAAPLTPAPAVLSLKLLGDVWLSVTDANGVQQVNKTAQAGETLNILGALPLSVVLGRANMVEVSVRGQRLDLAEWSNGNVARFEVK